MSQSELKVVSTFSGAGGIDLGFSAAGFKTVFATDIWDVACETLSVNSVAASIKCDDSANIDFRSAVSTVTDPDDIDVVVGGPPCPPYSKSRFYLKSKPRALEDDLSHTLIDYIRCINEIRPKVLFFENVHGFVYKPHQQSFVLLTSELQKIGYQLSFGVVNCADYGVPQTRERFICVGTRSDMPSFQFPEPTHQALPADSNRKYQIEEDRLTNIGRDIEIDTNVLQPWVTAGDAIGDIDFLLAEDDLKRAGSKHKHLLEKVPPGDNYLFFTEHRGHPNPEFLWRSRYWSFLLKLSPERPSWTIQASFSNNMGPFHWRNRFLRIEEIKRLQTIPDKHLLEGEFLDQWRLVGNGVPPELARVFAEAIKNQLFA